MAFDSDDDFSDNDYDDGFQQDMEALKKACLFAGKDADDLQPSSSSGDVAAGDDDDDDDVTPSVSDANEYDDDIACLRNLQERFSLSTELCEPINLKPLCSIFPPGSEGDEENDLETLRAIERRFAAYDDDSGTRRKESPLDKFEQIEPYRFLKDAVMTLLVRRISLRGIILMLKPQKRHLILSAYQNQHMHSLMP